MVKKQTQNKKNAQYVVEFAILVPFLICFAAFISQIGYSASINNKFQQALNFAVANSILSDDKEDEIALGLQNYMARTSARDIEVQIIDMTSVNNTRAVVASSFIPPFFSAGDLLFRNMNRGTSVVAFAFLNSSYFKNSDYDLNGDDVDNIKGVLIGGLTEEEIIEEELAEEEPIEEEPIEEGGGA